MSFASIIEKVLPKLPGLVAACSLIAVLGTSYVAMGLPVPATKAYVDMRDMTLKEGLTSVKVLIISNSLDQLDTRKGILRAEKLVIEQTLTGRIDLTTRSAFNGRLGQISDEMLALERRKDDLAKRTDDLERVK